ncbi:unnamed protein product [Candida verbasci]|uniref:non-specific serine/threonine protein kinase n=1 Tax=Candida verbasci TaxID=1227364 RepID=A0A9W4TVD9_9ASCO|nr:unnamed protein product [Candida verbasci]
MLFKKKEKTVSPSPSPPIAQAHSDLKRVNSGQSIKSNESIKSKHKLKSIFKSNKHDHGSASEGDIDQITNNIDSKLEIVNEQPTSDEFNKRISTIVENDQFSESESEFETGSEDDEIEYDHLHPVKPKFIPNEHELATHLSTIMGYCGFKKESQHVTELANEESKKTYSLLDKVNKIHKIPKANTGDSVIEDYQVELIQNLSSKMEKILEKKKLDLLKNEKSLYQRYGIIRNVIGRGSYGLIKIIDPDSDSSHPLQLNKFYNKTLYVVKELPKKKDENNSKFIERIMSEFVISSSLNNKHIVETVDLMCSLDYKINQVMICSQGGNLFSYLTTGVNIKDQCVSYMSFDEIDCFIKQIAKGLKYMHNHGVSHCDLKLENILITYELTNENRYKAKTVLKLSDFGKSFVFKTKFDDKEQYIQSGPIGTEPYIAPEEYLGDHSSVKKDIWALGIIVLVLYNIRRHYYSKKDQTYTDLEHRFTQKITDSQGYVTGYLWKSTESKSNGYKDKVFNEYSQKRMIANYDTKTKEWLIKRKGSFPPIEEICQDEDDELNELRIMILYKVLDIDPFKRMNCKEFLESDWMESIDACS